MTETSQAIGRAGTPPLCRICNYHDAPREWIQNPEPQFRCGSCGSIQVAVLPSQQVIDDFYGSRYLDRYSGGMPARKFEREMPKRHATKLRLVQRLARPNRLLDVGCGDASFLAQAKSAEIDCVGCDFGLRSEYPPGVSVVPADLDRHLPFPDNSFDAVTCWAVLEHVRTPHHAAAEIQRVLRPGGFAFWDTPLADDWCEVLVAARSHWFCPPEHLHVFSSRSLRLLAETAGMSVVLQSPFYERSVLRYVARRLRNIAVGAMAGGVLRVLSPPTWRRLRSQRVTGIGDIQLLVARKVKSASESKAA